MSKIFWSTRSAARATFQSVKDAGVTAPKGQRWYTIEVPAVPVKIIGLLALARKAKELFTADLARRIAQGSGTNTMFICQLFSTGPWEKVVGPHMNKHFDSGCNNIFSHITDVVGYRINSAVQLRAAEIVRLHWLGALIGAAEKHGDNAELPPLMAKEEIIKLVDSLK